MNTKKAVKQEQACWRSEAKNEELWRSRGRSYHAIQDLLQGHAAGWIAGVAWAKRQTKKRKTGQDAINIKIHQR